MKMDRFRDGALYDLLPSVVRQRDALSGGSLKRQLEAFGREADKLEESFSESYAGFFVETCSPRELAHIADLIGYRPIFFGPSEGRKGDGTIDPALRRDVAKTIWARRHKGTAEVLGAIVRLITGWHTVVFENSRAVVSTVSIRSAPVGHSQGTPDLRRLCGRAKVDRGPGLVARVATVRRANADEGKGRWHPLDVVIEAWSRSASATTEALIPVAGGYLRTIETLERARLYQAADASAEATTPLPSARAIRLSDFSDRKSGISVEAIYGHNSFVCLYRVVPGKEESTNQLVEIDVNSIMFGPVPNRAYPRRWIIDPEKGYVRPPTGRDDTLFMKYYRLDHESGDEKFKSVIDIRLEDHTPIESITGVVHRL